MAHEDGIKNQAQEFSREILADLSADAMKATIKKWFGKFMDDAGIKIAGGAANQILIMLFGPSTEDERRYELAVANMPANEYARLTKRLAKLTPDQSNYYRICILAEKTADIVKIMTAHAQMSDEAWKRHVRVMDYNRRKLLTTFQKFLKWATPILKRTDRRMAQVLNTYTRRLQNWRTQQVANNFGIEQQPRWGWLGRVLFLR